MFNKIFALNGQLFRIRMEIDEHFPSAAVYVERELKKPEGEITWERVPLSLPNCSI